MFLWVQFHNWPKFIMERGQFSTSHLHIPHASLLHCCLYSSKNLLNNTNVEDLDHRSYLADHSAPTASAGTREQGRPAWPEGQHCLPSVNWRRFVSVLKPCPDLFLKSTVLFFTWCVLTFQAKSENSSAGD